MKNIIIGTAGHVDHGKTRLIKALTGSDTDRLSEEKKRGITIENGFAHMETEEYNISFIDVPGHEKFIANMLAGIGGIDMVLLVISLDEGIMPQTREHFQILKTLGINKGIIVLTKDDLVDDEDFKELVEEDVSALAEGTFLENAPMIRVSAETGYNIDLLRDTIINNVKNIEGKNISGRFRMPVDRVFTAKGFGTVVTGTLLEGTVKKEDQIVIYPEGKKVRVRNVQVHSKDVEEALAGERTALNLAGISKEEIKRGDVLATEGSLESSMMLDVALEVFSDVDREVLNDSRVHFYSGAYGNLCKVILLDKDVLEPGERAFAQLRFEEPVSVRAGDRFIVRFYSPVISIGGGVVLDPVPEKHKRNREDVINSLKIKDGKDTLKIVELTVEENSRKLISLNEIENKMVEGAGIKESVEKLLKDEKIIEIIPGKFLHKTFLTKLFEEAGKILTEFHQKNPLSIGMKGEELKEALKKNTGMDNLKALEEVIVQGDKAKVLVYKDGLARLPEFKVCLQGEDLAMKNRLALKFKETGYSLLKPAQVIEEEKNKKVAKSMIDTLLGEGLIVKINQEYAMDGELYLEAKEIVKKALTEKGTITLAEFRDMAETSRKNAVMILENFDDKKFTEKVGDERIPGRNFN